MSGFSFRNGSEKKNGNSSSVTNNNHQSFPLVPSQLLPEVRESRLRRMLELIEEEPARKIQDLAVQFHLSPSYLEHLFKQETGISLGHLLCERRLQRAAHLLSNSTMSVKEIAFAVGYEHTSSFIRAFERRFQQPPRQYRRLNAA